MAESVLRHRLTMDAVIAITDVGTLSIIFRLSLSWAKPAVKTAENVVPGQDAKWK